MAAPEYTGGKTSYYEVDVLRPTNRSSSPYTAECNDIIEALNMTFAEGEAFKAIWRRAASRLRPTKQGYDNGLYDAKKVAFFGERMVVQHEAYGLPNTQKIDGIRELIEELEAFGEQLRTHSNSEALQAEFEAFMHIFRESLK